MAVASINVGKWVQENYSTVAANVGGYSICFMCVIAAFYFGLFARSASTLHDLNVIFGEMTDWEEWEDFRGKCLCSFG